MANGDLISAIAMTEPSGGSDLAALKTTAVRDGDDWILNGSKTFITNGYPADLVIVAARTDPSKGAKGITLFIVEAGMQGFSRGRKLDKVGQDESDTAELFFDNVRVPDANRLGEEGMGFIAMMQRLPQERIGAAVSNTAHAFQILERDDRVRQGAQGLRPGRSARSSTTSSSSPSSSDQAGGHPGLRRRLHRRPRRGQADRRSTRPRPSGGPRRCRTTSSTTACSSTAATGS